MTNEHMQAAIELLNAPEETITEGEAAAAESTTETQVTNPDGTTKKDNVEAAAAETEGEAAAGETKTDSEVDAEKDGNVADPDPLALPEDVEALPRVQELLQAEQFSNDIKDLLAEGYAIDPDNPAEALKQLRLERTDAHLLYDIVNGKADAGQFLNMLADPKNYDRTVAERVFTQLANSMSGLGFLQAYVAASGYKLVKAGTADATATAEPGSGPNPLEQKVDALASTLERQQAATRAADSAKEAERVNASRQETFTKFTKEVERLCEAKGVEKEFWPEYTNQVAAQINGNPAILKRLTEGKYVDVQRLFTLHHNAQVQRYQKWSKKATTAKETRDANIPKVPAGGSPPAPAAAKKRSLVSYDDRMAAVMEQLK